MIQLKPVTIDPEYRKKWNIYMKDYCHLYINGEKVRDTLYRVGGFGYHPDKPYFMLIKGVESIYPDHIAKDKKHLAGHWCILDQQGNEKVEFKQFDTPYLVGGLLYLLDGHIYNIETGECYCTGSSNYIESNTYMFIQNKYDKDKTKRGVIKINKSDGTYELFQ